jgi:hypothetical protein
MYILWSLGPFCGDMVYFSLFCISYKENSSNPDVDNDIGPCQKVGLWLFAKNKAYIHLFNKA